MRTATRWLAVAVIVSLAVMTGKVWALQTAEQVRTPQQVVTEFADALALYTMTFDEELLSELLSDDSSQAMYELYNEVTYPLIACIAFSRLMPAGDVRPEGDAVVVTTTPQPRPLSVVVVKERGQWKVDLLATLEKLPEPFRPDVELMRQQVEESLDLSNIRQIAAALLVYAHYHDMHLPSAEKWMDEIEPYIDSPEVFRSPSASQLEYGYAFNDRLSGVNIDHIALPSPPVVFGSDLNRRNAAGGPEAVTDPPRHDGGIAYAFTDGGVHIYPVAPNFEPQMKLESEDAAPPGAAAPLPQLGEQSPAADTGEAEQSGPVIDIMLDNFKEQVLQAEIPVLVEFWSRDGAGWDDFRLAFDELARDYAGTVRFGSVDANRNIPLTIAFQVVRIPCLVLFHSGEELARTTGYMNKQELQDWIEQNLGAQD